MAPTHDPKRKTGPLTAKFKALAPGFMPRLKEDASVEIVHIEYEPETILTLTLLDPDSFKFPELEHVEDVQVQAV